MTEGSKSQNLRGRRSEVRASATTARSKEKTVGRAAVPAHLILPWRPSSVAELLRRVEEWIGEGARVSDND